MVLMPMNMGKVENLENLMVLSCGLKFFSVEMESLNLIRKDRV